MRICHDMCNAALGPMPCLKRTVISRIDIMNNIISCIHLIICYFFACFTFYSVFEVHHSWKLQYIVHCSRAS